MPAARFAQGIQLFDEDYAQKSPTNVHKSPIYDQKSHIYVQKSRIYFPKSPICVRVYEPAARFPEGIQLIDKDHARRLFACAVEELTNCHI